MKTNIGFFRHDKHEGFHLILSKFVGQNHIQNIL